jgi:hypothetical protein
MKQHQMVIQVNMRIPTYQQQQQQQEAESLDILYPGSVGF